MKLELFFREQLLTTNHFSEVVNNAIIGNKAEKREDERNKKKIGSDEMWTTSTAAIIGIISKRLRDWQFGDFCDFILVNRVCVLHLEKCNYFLRETSLISF